MHSRDEAVNKVESGDVLAALILPEDLINQINSLSTLAPGTPKVEVIVNESNPLKAGATEDKITALLAQANLAIAKRIAVEGSKYLNLVIKGGDLPILGGTVHILGPAVERPASSKGSNRRCRKGRCARRSAG